MIKKFYQRLRLLSRRLNRYASVRGEVGLNEGRGFDWKVWMCGVWLSLQVHGGEMRMSFMHRFSFGFGLLSFNFSAKVYD